MSYYRSMTIAGSDSGGGAGIQADLKTFTALSTYGLSVITALTAQNTKGVTDIHTPPASFVTKQLEAVLTDIGADATKTGMLANGEIIEVVAKSLSTKQSFPVVVDPVMVATSGDVLLQKSAIDILKRKLLPLATVVTPNLAEAEILTGINCNTIDEMMEAATMITSWGASSVVIKGGHSKGAAIDIVYDGESFYELSAPRIPSNNTHGTGCTFSAAITAYLARGVPLIKALYYAKCFITAAIKTAVPLGSGNGPTNHLIGINKNSTAAAYQQVGVTMVSIGGKG